MCWWFPGSVHYYVVPNSPPDISQFNLLLIFETLRQNIELLENQSCFSQKPLVYLRSQEISGGLTAPTDSDQHYNVIFIWLQLFTGTSHSTSHVNTDIKKTSHQIKLILLTTSAQLYQIFNILEVILLKTEGQPNTPKNAVNFHIKENHHL